MKFGTDEYIEDRVDRLSKLTMKTVKSETERCQVKFDLLVACSEITDGWSKDGAIAFKPSSAFVTKVKDIVLPAAGVTWELLRTQVPITHPWFSDAWNEFNEKQLTYGQTSIMQDLSNAFRKILSFSEAFGKAIIDLEDPLERLQALAKIGIDIDVPADDDADDDDTDDENDIDSEILIREKIFRSTAKALRRFTYDSISWNDAIVNTPAQLLIDKVKRTKKSGKKDVPRARTLVLRDFARELNGVKADEISITVEDDNAMISYNPQSNDDANDANDANDGPKILDLVPSLPAVYINVDFNEEFQKLNSAKAELDEAMEEVDKRIAALTEKKREIDARDLANRITDAIKRNDFDAAHALMKAQEVRVKAGEQAAIEEGENDGDDDSTDESDGQ